MNVCFIPHVPLAQELVSNRAFTLNLLQNITGATEVTYHMEGVRYIRLVNPKISVKEIRADLSNNFASKPVWVEE